MQEIILIMPAGYGGDKSVTLWWRREVPDTEIMSPVIKQAVI